MKFKPRLFTRQVVIIIFVLGILNFLSFAIACFFSQLYLNKKLHIPILFIYSSIFLVVFSWFFWSMGRKRRLRRLSYSLILVSLSMVLLKKMNFFIIYFLMNLIFATITYPILLKIEKWKKK